MNKVYFLNVDFGGKLTGIERSALKRACLFKNHLNNIPVFITSKLNLNLEKNILNLKKIGWMPEECQVINIYDELRNRGISTCQLVNQFDSFNSEDYEIVDINDRHQRFFSKTGNFSMYVVWKDESKRKVEYINYFSQSKKIRREKYDTNNRLYLTQYLDQECNVEYENVYNIAGELILKKVFNVEKKSLRRIERYSQLKLLDIYNSEQEFICSWLKEINIEKNSLLIIDKNKFWSLAASQMRPYCKVVSILHSIHLRESSLNNVCSGQLNSNYAPVLNQKHMVDAILTLTEEQKLDIVLRYGELHKVFVIPHSIDNNYDFSENNEVSGAQNIVALCRLAPEKQIEDMMAIISILKNRNCHVKLYVYGEGGERGKLEKIIQDLELQNHVFLPGYVSDIKEVYRKGFLTLLTSKCEGFSLAILESLSHSVPVIAYDIKYGPKSMVKHGENGYLFPMKSHEEIANTIENLINDTNLLKNLRVNAYKSSLKYTELEVAKKWKLLIDETYDATVY